MATTIKVLGQSNPLATTLTNMYTVPVLTEAVGSSIMVCNRSGAATTFRVAVSPGGAGISDEHYIYYDVDINGNDTFAATLGITLQASSIVRVYAADATLSFSLFGQEIT